MKITEIILEHDNLNEGLGSAIATGVRNVARGAGAVAGGAVGAWDAAKAGYHQGRAAVAGPYNRGQPGTSSSASTSNAPASSSTSASASGAPASTSGSAPSGSPTGTPASSAASSSSAPSSTPTATPASGSATAPVAMKSAEIVKDLDDVWKKATADQGSQTTSAQVQQQIRAMAKAAGMTGQTLESKKNKRSVVEYQSKFLGITI